MSALQFEQATIRLGGRDILAAVTFTIEPGEFIGMLGANGAGKTTLLRAALGLIPVSAGEIRVLGKPVSRGNPDVGYLPQNRGAAVSLRIRGYDVVATAAMGARFGIRRLDAETRRRIDRALDLVGASALSQRPIGELSGGERQRLLLSQALLGDPKLLLLDEPLISLDPAQQTIVVEIARTLRDELGLAILFSAHELNPLVNRIDRVLYLGAGAAVLGLVDDVVTGPVLSRLYRADIEVVRVKDHYFVMAGGVEVERDAHLHEGGYGHAHG